MLDIDWREFEFAESLIGQKALLMGGGQLANAFIVVDVLGSFRKSGQMFVRHESGTMNPYIMSYYIRPLREDLQDLELGDYLLGFNGDIRKQDAGLFGSIYNCTLVKTINDKGEFIDA